MILLPNGEHPIADRARSFLRGTHCIANQTNSGHISPAVKKPVKGQEIDHPHDRIEYTYLAHIDPNPGISLQEARAHPGHRETGHLQGLL